MRSTVNPSPPAPSTVMPYGDGSYVIPDELPIRVRQEHEDMPVWQFFGIREEP